MPLSLKTQKKQNIVWLTSSYPRFEKDSASIFLRYLAESIDPHIFEIHVLAPDDSQVDGSLSVSCVCLHYFKYFMPRYLQHLAYGSGILPNLKANPLLFLQVPLFLLSQFWAAYRLVKKKRPLLIHAHWIFPQGAIANLVGQLTKTPVIITAHGGDAFGLQGSILAKIKRWSLNGSVAWTSNTLATANAVLGEIKQPKIIPMGINFHAFKTGTGKTLRRLVDKNCLILLSVGRLVEKKGGKYLLLAYAQLPALERQKTLLWIVGDGTERKALESLSASLKLTQYVTFFGKLANDQLPDYYAASDIFIAPSITDSRGDTEGQGVTLLEAMASNTPVISTRTGGISEVVEHHKTGLLVPPEKPEKLAEAIVLLINNPVLRNSLSQAGLKKVESYAWPNIGQQFKMLYQHT